MERITHAAILRNDRCIIFGKNHAECIELSPYGTCREDAVQGFLTDKLRFVNRKAAASIAFQAKQIDNIEPNQVLVSEELWSSGGKHIYDEKFGYVIKDKEDE